MRGEAVVRTGFDGDADAFCCALLACCDGFVDVGSLVAGQGIVELGDELFAVLWGEGHEGAAHDDVLDFVDAVAETADLVYAAAGLFEGVVAGADCSHACGFVAGVALGAVFEVAVWSSGTVDADIACVCDMRTSMRFAHDGYHRYPTGTPYRLRNELG